MFFKNYHILFLSLLFSGTIIAVSANSWFTCWLGLEINLMSMIPLMIIKLNPPLAESAIKYFLAQAIASVILIFSSSFSLMFTEMSLEILEAMILITLSLKAGMAPFHFWFPQVTFNLSWFQCLLIFTWQKIAPLILLCSLSFNLIMMISMASALVGALGGFNQIYLKLILTYSSISHGGWMLVNCFLNFNSWAAYFSIYSFISFSIILFFQNNNLLMSNNIFMGSDSYINKNILIFNMFSLGGLPPLLGFIAKLNVIVCAVKMNLTLIFMVLIISSIISLFFYSRVTYNNLMSMNKTIMMKTITAKPKNFFYSISIFSNALAPLAFILF